jgi:plasmid stabilization system protein ParE
MVQIKWLKQAIADLNDIYEYISHDSVKYAERQVERIWDRTAILKDNVHAGKQVEELNREDICELIEGRYRIIYQIVSEELIHILMIHHSARDLSKRK